MKDTCDECGRRIRRGEWYWYRITYHWETRVPKTELLCNKCIRGKVDTEEGSFGWQTAYNGPVEKDNSLPEFSKLCTITTKGGNEYPARLIKLDPKYHQSIKEHRVWRREDAKKRSERYIELGDVIAWRREDEK